jgi:phosphatidylinositol alpha-1,6-mannosyltransferase
MRVLVVTRNLPPLIGGMERLNWHLVRELAAHSDVRVIGPKGAASMAPSNIIVREVPLKPLWRFLWAANWAALIEAMCFRPQVILAGSGLTAPIALLASLMSGARAVSYVHGLDLTAKHWVYRALWLPAIRRMHRIIANSQATASLATSASIVASKISIVPPGVELPGAGVNAEAVHQFRQKHHLENKAVLLSVGRLNKRKGLAEFVKNALPYIVSQRPDALLLVIGDTPHNALHAQGLTPEAIQAIADAAGVGGHVRFLGSVSDHELEIAFSVADVHVFPVRHISSDPEGFGMVALEAAAHGVPTVAFAMGGVPDAVSDGKSGYLVESENYPEMVRKVIDALGEKQRMGDSCRAFASQFAWPVFGKKIIAELQRAM